MLSSEMPLCKALFTEMWQLCGKKLFQVEGKIYTIVSFGLQSTYWYWEKQEMIYSCSLVNEELQYKFVLSKGHKALHTVCV